MAKRAMWHSRFLPVPRYLRASAVPGVKEGKGKVRALWHIRQGQGVAGRPHKTQKQGPPDSAGKPSGSVLHIQCPEAEQRRDTDVRE
jgi:hypothetical protein